MLIAVIVSLVVGVVIGLALGRRSQPPTHGAVTTPAPRTAAVDDLGSVVRSAADQLELGMVVADAAGTVVYRNRAATALNGTHVGVIVEDYIERALATSRAGGRVDDLVELYGPPQVSLQIVAEPMPGGFAVAIVEDVSERTRTDMMRTDFVANISHELKTPVGAIAVLGEALIGETDSEVIDRVASRMIDEAHRAASAIDDLLELARIESGPVLEEIVDLEEVVAAAIARGRVVDAPDGVTVTAFDGYPNVRVRADRRQLVAALGNLVENAVKYSDPGGAVQVLSLIHI